MGASRTFVCPQPPEEARRDEDSTLVAAVQAGDVSAYAELFRRHHLAVKRVCARRLGEVEADEVAQATFVRAFERIDQCLGDRRFGAWVQVIAQRLCLDLIRARTRTVPDDDPLRDDRLALNVVIDLDAGTVTEEALVRRERTELVQEALALLPDRQREVVVARHFEGRRPAEIAASLGLSVGAVDSLLLRARRRLALNYEHVLADSSVAAPSATSAGAGVASAGVPVHLPGLPDAVARAAHHAASALPALAGDAHAPLRRLVAVVAAAAAPILISAPPATTPTTTTMTSGPRVSPPALEAGQRPPALEAGQRPPALEAGQRPPALEAGQRPAAVEAGQRPTAPATGKSQEPGRQSAVVIAPDGVLEPVTSALGPGTSGGTPTTAATGRGAAGPGVPPTVVADSAAVALADLVRSGSGPSTGPASPGPPSGAAPAGPAGPSSTAPGGAPVTRGSQPAHPAPGRPALPPVPRPIPPEVAPAQGASAVLPAAAAPQVPEVPAVPPPPQAPLLGAAATRPRG